ncbi:MAG: CdaR family protein [Anaerolineae bacterium]
MAQQQKDTLTSNLLWLLGSFLLAFFVWVMATSAADPIDERRFPTLIPIQLSPPNGLIIIEQPRSTTARVTVRSQESVYSLLTPEDIVVRADLSNLGPGTHTVELDADVARRAFVVDTQPRQITVTLEEIQAQQVDVVANITEPPPTGYEHSTPSFSETQVLVRGAASRVAQVVAAQADIDLSQQRSLLETNARLVPVDADGRPVENVTIEPQIVQAEVEVTLPENVREVPVRTNINVSSLPEGYDVVSFTPNIRVVTVSGSRIPNVLETEEIPLTNRTEDFVVTVPILLPNNDVFILDGQEEITVSIDIEPRIITRNFENVPVRTIGLADNLEAQFVTDEVTLLISGPQVELEQLAVENLQVIVDLNGLGPGSYERAPIALNGQVQIEADNLSVSPPTIAVTLVDSNNESE